MSRLISISNFARGNVVPAYRLDQIDKMLANDFSDSDPAFVDAATGEPLETDEVRRRLATASGARPVFASADTRKVERAIAAHARAQALMMGATASADQPGFTKSIHPAVGELVDGVFKLGGRG